MDGNGKSRGNAVADEAARITGRWLARHGLEVAETTVEGLDGSERPGGIKITSPAGNSTFDSGLKSWDWAGRDVSRDEAWLAVVQWLFLEGRPYYVQETVSAPVSPGWTGIRRRRFEVPKLRFSSLAEFVFKASVHPDFPSPDGGEEVS